MEKVDFTPTQKLVFEEFAKFKPLPEQFYLTGGTALSVFYLSHRYSNDLDFFSEQEPKDQIITAFMKKISSLVGLKHRFTVIEQTRVFEFQKKGKLLLKVDFAYYPYPRLRKGKTHHGVSVDSLLDIATNKLLLVSQRSDIKDFVDLYFLLKKVSVWDLMYGIEKKFKREIDILLLSADFLKVKDFDFLPKMVKPLNLKDLQKFFKQKVKEIARKAIEE